MVVSVPVSHDLTKSTVVMKEIHHVCYHNYVHCLLLFAGRGWSPYGESVLCACVWCYVLYTCSWYDAMQR